MLLSETPASDHSHSHSHELQSQKKNDRGLGILKQRYRDFSYRDFLPSLTVYSSPS